MSDNAPEYQHFVPQFILRNFDHPFSCPEARTKGLKCKKHHHEKGKYPGDPVVNCLELSPQDYRIEELSIRRVCGRDDMYTDQSPQATFPRELEKKFSKLEGQTSAVIRKIIVLRKFVYLLNQRGSGFFKTYNCNSIDDYKRNDRDLLKEFMERNGIQRPEHITEFWMSFCTPSSEDQEFILSDTGSHVYEGPTIDFQDKTTGDFLRQGPRFHLFAPISPRLMIVLRSKHLPEPHEDKNPEVKAGLQLWRQIEIDSIYGTGTKSILETLPVHKAINSYSTLVNGVLRKRPGWDGQLRQTDTFSFPFFKISTHHGRIMNGLLLDHAFHGRTVIFNKKATFFDLLEWFLTEACEVGKRLGGEHHAEQMRYLSRLTALMHTEGRNVSLCITNSPVSNHLDMEGYKTQNNAAARWLESLEKKNASEGAIKQKQPQSPDASVDAVQYTSAGLQDQPKNEKSTIEGQATDHDPTLKREEELSQAEFTSLHASEYSTQFQSANSQRAHEQLVTTMDPPALLFTPRFITASAYDIEAGFKERA
ncbi:hypothetical protein FMEXI_1048 [Fusarium mexicanum]|uniref:Uncharacterized protein n=1 Tax=Fusarium mexicanum TaxID=751941 RepID=A0A8H5JNY1_9HYPO|nr:hypothetical protein FMEXI_1048 [Fusarium mexicanum]